MGNYFSITSNFVWIMIFLPITSPSTLAFLFNFIGKHNVKVQIQGFNSTRVPTLSSQSIWYIELVCLWRELDVLALMLIFVQLFLHQYSESFSFSEIMFIHLRSYLKFKKPKLFDQIRAKETRLERAFEFWNQHLSFPSEQTFSDRISGISSLTSYCCVRSLCWRLVRITIKGFANLRICMKYL